MGRCGSRPWSDAKRHRSADDHSDNGQVHGGQSSGMFNSVKDYLEKWGQRDIMLLSDGSTRKVTLSIDLFGMTGTEKKNFLRKFGHA